MSNYFQLLMENASMTMQIAELRQQISGVSQSRAHDSGRRQRWSVTDDEELFRYVSQFGENPKVLSQHVANRSENQIYYHLTYLRNIFNKKNKQSLKFLSKCALDYFEAVQSK
ncbi:SANT/Myb_domain [Hexamita inflata]|uniref:SANT/Myb domain n=1 Tax=Hexamita inflata TaxID=28002 RepID=A0AA86RTA2_9EUKA|nr:SANT/Myb domain [Hexamita inflata]CAI9977569.1 SANT/Myb domain [Hexamita inflata]